MKDETVLTGYIASALDRYITKHTRRSYAPHITRQSLKNFVDEEVFPDLIKKISESKNILLEVKIREFRISKRSINYSNLRHYKDFQASFYSAMEECGVPIYYSYNLTEEPQHDLTSEQVLQSNSATLPSVVRSLKGKFPNNFSTDTLLEIVDNLINEGGSIEYDESGSGVLFPFSALPPERQGLRYALLTYSDQEGLELFDEEELRLIGSYLSRRLDIDVVNQNAPITELSKEQLKDLFFEYREKFRLFLQETLVVGQNSAGLGL